MRKPDLRYGNVAWKAVSSESFMAYPMATVYVDIAKRLGLNFDATIRLLSHMPSFLSNQAHKESRRRLAQRISEAKQTQETNVSEVIGGVIDKIDECGGSFDVLETVSEPVWIAISTALCPQAPAIPQAAVSVPELFNPYTSIRRRLVINDEIENILCQHDNSALDALALLSLGFRPLTGTIALSMHHLASKHSGRRLSQITYPSTFPVSALSFVDRIAQSDGSVTEEGFNRGQRYRCVIFDESYQQADNDRNIYGLGGHVCLGRSISQYMWNALCEGLMTCNTTIAPGTLQIGSTEPFTVPTTCKLHLSYD